MELHRPLAALTPTLDADVLTVLARADSQFTGERVASLVSDGSPSGVRKVLKRLVDVGLAHREVVGPAHLYSLNRDHLAAPYIDALARLRDEFDRCVESLVEAWEVRPVVIVLFGSAARGEMAPDSDIDLFVVGGPNDDEEQWQRQLDDLAEKVTAWTGNDARVLEMTPDEVRAATSEQDHLVASIREDGQVLYGDSRYLNKLALDVRRS